MAVVNGRKNSFCPPGFTGLNGESYQLVRFAGGIDFHYEGLKNLLTQQADEHGLSFGEEKMGPLTEALKNSGCSVVLCVKQNENSSQSDKVVGMMSYTKEISLDGKIYFLEDIVVDQKHRGQRIGSKCISSFILNASKHKKGGFRLYSKENNVPGFRLFNNFGNVLFQELPAVMEIPIPKEPVSLPKNVAELEPKHIHDVCLMINRYILNERPTWNLVDLISQVANNQIAGTSGLVSIKNGQVNGAAILCTGFGTLSGTTYTHVPIIAGNGIPSLVYGIKYIHKREWRRGLVTLDFRDNRREDLVSLVDLAEHAGAKVLKRANARMLPGALGGEAFSYAAQIIARRLFEMVNTPSKEPTIPGSKATQDSKERTEICRGVEAVL